MISVWPRALNGSVVEDALQMDALKVLSLHGNTEYTLLILPCARNTKHNSMNVLTEISKSFYQNSWMQYFNLCSGQFIACPHGPNGGDCDESKTPDVVNNSWGGGGGATYYEDVIDTWIHFGIVPVFANGNSLAFCGTTNYPGNCIPNTKQSSN